MKEKEKKENYIHVKQIITGEVHFRILKEKSSKRLSNLFIREGDKVFRAKMLINRKMVIIKKEIRNLRKFETIFEMSYVLEDVKDESCLEPQTKYKKVFFDDK